jgi:hypothetical protein
MPGFEPALKVEPGTIRGFGSRESARRKADPLCFLSYCFLKALAVIHLHQLPVRPELVEGLPL